MYCIVLYCITLYCPDFCLHKYRFSVKNGSEKCENSLVHYIVKMKRKEAHRVFDLSTCDKMVRKSIETRSRLVKMNAKYGSKQFLHILILENMERKADHAEMWGREPER